MNIMRQIVITLLLFMLPFSVVAQTSDNDFHRCVEQSIIWAVDSFLKSEHPNKKFHPDGPIILAESLLGHDVIGEGFLRHQNLDKVKALYPNGNHPIYKDRITYTYISPFIWFDNCMLKVNIRFSREVMTHRYHFMDDYECSISYRYVFKYDELIDSWIHLK